MAIQLLSNVKIITSGQMPTPDNLQPGEAAFGKLTSDGKYHLFGNSDGEVVDIILSTLEGMSPGTSDLQQVLENGNTTDLSIEFNSDNNTVIISSNGITWNGYPYLSSNPDSTITTDEATTIRNKIDSYSKEEVNNLISTIPGLSWEELT